MAINKRHPSGEIAKIMTDPVSLTLGACPLGDPSACMNILQQLTEIATQLETFRKELLGNGQPGRVQRVEAAIASLQDRVVKVEKSAEASESTDDMRDAIAKNVLYCLVGLGIGLLIALGKQAVFGVHTP